MKPICVDFYCGLGGWAEGFLAEDFEVIGFDIERHDYGTGSYPGHLVLQDVLTLVGKQFTNPRIACFVASPPCQEPSYRAMPWKRAKALNAIGPPHKFIALFDACFRIQREVYEATGRRIPLIVENVVGAQKWVGRAAWHFGSYYLWGDLPALMPIPSRRAKINGQNWSNFAKTGEVSPHWRMESLKNEGGSWFNVAHNTTSGKGHNPDGRKIPTSCAPRRWEERDVKRLRDVPVQRIEEAGVKQVTGGNQGWFGEYRQGQGTRNYSSNSVKRKAASAQIAKIPFPLARHIARCFKPCS